ncbi:MAG: hypothetical protein RRB13_13825 [bacterium]|nr:hypothetical protein [bacterium]
MSQHKLIGTTSERVYEYENSVGSGIRQEMKTGDLLLFSGTSATSMVIRLGTRSRWSHVGMVMVLEEFDEVMLWESTTLTDVEDAETKTYRAGVQLVPLSARLANYPGDVVWRPLQLQAGQDRKEIGKVLAVLRKEWKLKRYESDMWELMKAAYDGPGGQNQEDLGEMFCSEMVSEAYQRCGLLAEVDQGGLPSNEYTPKDFSEARNLDLIDARLGEQRLIKRYSRPLAA